MIPSLSTPNTVSYMHSVLLSSLQAEFNYHAASWMPEVLRAKQRQIALLEQIIGKYEQEQYKLTKCGITFVKPDEIKYAEKPIGVPKGWKSNLPNIKEIINGL
jgi:hypothetical protein